MASIGWLHRYTAPLIRWSCTVDDRSWTVPMVRGGTWRALVAVRIIRFRWWHVGGMGGLRFQCGVTVNSTGAPNIAQHGCTFLPL